MSICLSMANVKKNLIIIIFLLAGAIIALLFLNLNSSWKNGRAEILDPYSVPENLPKKISRGRVNFFGLQGSKVVFYEESDSTIYEAGLDGKNKKELVRIPDVLKIVFSPIGYELVAIVSAEKSIPRNYYFDLKNNKRTELPRDAQDITFSPDGRKIAYFFYDGETGEGGILTAAPDGSDSKAIFRTRIKNLDLAWPRNDLIIFYSGEGDGQSLAFSIGPDGKGFQKLTREETTLYADDGIRETGTLEKLGIKITAAKLGPLKDYLIFLNAEDGKLYSFGI